MKVEWKTMRLDEICDEITDGSHFSPKTVNMGLPYITVRDIENDKIDFNNCKFISETDFNQLLKNGCNPRRGDVLFSKDGTVGKVALIDYDKDFVVLSSLAIVRPDKRRIDSAFLKYVMKSTAFLEEAVGKKTGLAIRRIILRNLKSIPVPVPPLPEQQRIVRILDEAFDGIATAKANAEKNLQNSRALFERYLQTVFTQQSEEWVERKLGDKTLVEIIDGDRGVNYPKASDFNEEGHCLFLNTKNVRPDGFEFESTMFINKEKDGKLRKGKLKRNDVVMTTRGTIGNIGLYSDNIEFENIRINSGMLIFRVNQKQLLPSFLFELLRSHIVKEQIKKHTSGAAQPQLPIKTIVNFSIPVPVSVEKQQSIVDTITRLYGQTQCLESVYWRKLAALDELKKALLHRAFSGEL